MPELIGYSEDGTPQYSFSDEDKLKGISVRPYNALLDPAPVEGTAAEQMQSPLPVDVTGVGAVPSNTTGFETADRLFGLNGQERFQTWPERMVRSGVSLAHDVATGELPITTLRREDVTDEPAPQGATADSSLIGRLLNLSPIAADPRDPLIERAQDMAGLAGGATLGINPAEMTVASGMTKMASKMPEKFSNIEDLMKTYSDQGIRNYIADRPSRNQIQLSDLVVPKANQGQGLGSAFMKDLIDFADAQGKTVTLTASADKNLGTTSLNRLKAFYKQFGFVENKGRNKDFTISNTMYRLPNKSNNVKLTPIEGNPFLASDTQKSGMALSALEKPAPVFYSALENAVNNITANKMPADQWLGTLTNAKGVRPEEMEWTGLKDFLAEQKGPVTKDQVQQYLDANKVELKEVLRKNNDEFDPDVIGDGAIREHFGLTRNDFSTVTPEMRQQYMEEVQGGLPTKFSKYQLPGGENYRETLLTLPDQSPRYKLEDLKPLSKDNPAYRENSNIIQVQTPDNVFEIAKSNRLDRKIETFDDAAKYIIQNKKPNLAELSNFKSSHWDEPNVLAHVRMNDRTIDGKKSLHLEEIQSDWHQIARDKGYAVSADKIEKLRPQFDKIDNKLLNSNDEQVLGHPEVDGMLKMAVNKKIITPDEAKIYKQVSDTAQTGAVPDAPFKKTWHELVLKRMLREAAEKGYSRLSWTPGEAQAARYDLSKQIDRLAYDPITNRLLAFQKGSSHSLHMDETVKPEKLSDYIGKETAEKLINTPSKKDQILDGFGKSKYNILENADLKIGGEGMKGFYDTIIPKALEKIGKEHGVKVKQGEINNGYDAITNSGDVHAKFEDKPSAEHWIKMMNDAARNGPYKVNSSVYKLREKSEPIHYINIPQSLKDQALRKGFPLFSSGVMLSPVEQSPFDNQPKLTPVDGNPFE